MKQAKRFVDECIKENILADFLRKNRAEVISMSIFEYDKEEEEKKLRKAEYEAGIQRVSLILHVIYWSLICCL